jgi:hypothetical protein
MRHETRTEGRYSVFGREAFLPLTNEESPNAGVARDPE